MPTITTTEVAVIGAAFFILYMVPGVLAWSDELRRRRLRRQEALAYSVPLEPVAMASEPLLGAPGAELVGFPATLLPEVNPGVSEEAWPDQSNPQPVPEVLAFESITETVEESTLPVAEEAAPAAPSGIELHPIEGAARHRFRIRDLHTARLADWPPAAIRDDAEVYRVWQHAEQVAATYREALELAEISSPYPARSTCLGAGEVDGEVVRLRYFLFPVLWPVSQNQAVAQAVFEINPVLGNVGGWVDALRDAELSEENRQEIRESGGQA